VTAPRCAGCGRGARTPTTVLPPDWHEGGVAILCGWCAAELLGPVIPADSAPSTRSSVVTAAWAGLPSSTPTTVSNARIWRPQLDEGRVGWSSFAPSTRVMAGPVAVEAAAGPLSELYQNAPGDFNEGIRRRHGLS
jgi:hypothetical protein